MKLGEKNDRELEVDVSPEMQIYRVLQHLSYGVETALAELIDNSIQSYVDGRNISSDEDLGKYLSVRVDVDGDTITLTDDACGINLEDMQRAVKPGFESNHPSNSLSVYGIGMKSAALWFSEDWSIKTSVEGENYCLNFNFDLQKILNNHSSTENVIVDNEDVDKHYTIITLKRVTRIESKDYYESTVLPFLLEIFVKFRHFLNIDVYYNNVLLKPKSKKLLLDVPKAHIYPVVNSSGIIIGGTPVEWRVDFDFLYKCRAVRGFILLMEVGGYGQPGIRLLRNNRVIEGTSVYPNVPDNLLGTRNKYAAQRIYGELELDDFPVDFMKTRFNDNLKGLFDEINKRLSSYHYNILKQATGFRKGESSKPENKAYVENMLATVKSVRADNPEIVTESKPKTEIFLGEGKPEPSLNGGINEGSNSDVENPGAVVAHPNAEGTERPPTPPPVSNFSNGSDNIYEPLPENRIEKSEKLLAAFDRFPGDKLPQLYTSLCTISLKKHAVMCYVAAWSLLESWSSAMDKKDGVDFHSFLASKLNNFESDRGKRNTLRQVISDMQGKGNCNKHSGIFGNTHALDLKHYFIILEPFVIYETEKYFSGKSNN